MGGTKAAALQRRATKVSQAQFGSPSGRRMKIMSVKIRNFRNHENLDIQFNGANFLIIGENAIGKSNILKAISAALGNGAGIDAVMKGKKESEVELVADDEGKRYEFQVKMKAGSDKATVTVRAPDGLKANTKSVIGGIVGEMDFDIDKFVELSKTDKGRREQVEIVRGFLDEETRAFLRKHETNSKVLYDQRTEVNREIKAIEGFIKESGFNPLDFGKIEPIDMPALDAKMRKIVEKNANFAKSETAYNQLDLNMMKNMDRVVKAREEIEALEVEIAQLEEANEEARVQRIKIEQWQAKNPFQDIKEIQEEIRLAQENNQKFENLKLIKKQEERLEKAREESGELTAQYEAGEEAIRTAIRDSASPIEGLTFDNDRLLYLGMPVDESTMSTSEIMMLGIKLKMAQLPGAHVLLIERGESLGIAKYRELQKLSHDYGFQIIMEQMERGVEELRIELMPEI